MSWLELEQSRFFTLQFSLLISVSPQRRHCPKFTVCFWGQRPLLGVTALGVCRRYQRLGCRKALACACSCRIRGHRYLLWGCGRTVKRMSRPREQQTGQVTLPDQPGVHPTAAYSEGSEGQALFWGQCLRRVSLLPSIPIRDSESSSGIQLRSPAPASGTVESSPGLPYFLPISTYIIYR